MTGQPQTVAQSLTPEELLGRAALLIEVHSGIGRQNLDRILSLALIALRSSEGSAAINTRIVGSDCEGR